MNQLADTILPTITKVAATANVYTCPDGYTKEWPADQTGAPEYGITTDGTDDVLRSAFAPYCMSIKGTGTTSTPIAGA